jgi:hypothetical protein
MSNALAIASVTAVLKNLLDNGMVDAKSSGPVTVGVSPPDRIATGESEQAQLNLFLYSVAPNLGWRNVGLPSRDAEGQPVSNPPLALDLYYLLSAYEKGDFDAEILLGYAMQILHETPVLDRAAVRTALGVIDPAKASSLPSPLNALAMSDLAEQAEQIKIAPHRLDVDEMSKLWTAFQAKYRPSAAYHVSVVLIESTRPVRSPLPVLSRGRPVPSEGRDEGVAVQPNLLPPVPTLESLAPPDNNPSVRLGEVLTVIGHRLAGTNLSAVCRTRLLKDPIHAFIKAGGGSERLEVVIPSDPIGWPAGVYTLELTLTDPEGRSRRTNALPFALVPRVALTSATQADGKVTAVVVCAPHVRPGQTAALIIGQSESSADVTAVSPELTFTFAGLSAGTYPYHLRVDGMESLLIDRTVTPPVFDTDQMVTLPKVVTP